MVNIEALCKFAGKDDSELRPLKAWKAIQVNKGGQTSLGWIIELDGQKVILKNPPVAEWTEFSKLKIKHDAAVKRLEELKESSHRAIQEGSDARRERANMNPDAIPDNAKRSKAWLHEIELRKTINRSEETQSANREEAYALEVQIEKLQSLGYGDFGDFSSFSMLCFALDTKQTSDGMPIFDRGIISK